MKLFVRGRALLLASSFLLAGCNFPAPAEPTPIGPAPISYAPTRTPFQPVPDFPTEVATTVPESQVTDQLYEVTSTATVAASPTALSSPTPVPVTPTALPSDLLSLAPGEAVPPSLVTALQSQPGFALVPPGSLAMLTLQPGAERVVARWVYALVAPFPTTVQGVSLGQVQRAWQGEQVGPFAGKPLLLEASTLEAFTALWGAPAGGAVRVLSAGELLDTAWGDRPSWTLIPFEQVQARWKVLEVDGLSPLHKGFDPATYPLAVPFSVSGEPDALESATELLTTPLTNYDPSRLTTVVLTGVTALVRATAFTMEQQGINYPAGDIGDLLATADITHISNEVPFAENCPFPNPVQQDLRFCSDTRYIGLLERVGTDVVELTGDHFQDWGQEAMLLTLQMYRERNWPYYGGGADSEEARAPLLLEHNGNRIAFIGCNGKGGSFAQAGPNRPGAAACDMNYFTTEITRLREEGYLPIATFQHYEYYTYSAQAPQVRDFTAAAEAGAVVVSGSQAHQPQAFAFHGNGLIHYGLGNLFFDQYSISEATRQGFLDRHVFYDGRYLGVELIPIYFIDYARPRFMTPEERSELLRVLFSASGW